MCSQLNYLHILDVLPAFLTASAEAITAEAPHPTVSDRNKIKKLDGSLIMTLSRQFGKKPKKIYLYRCLIMSHFFVNLHTWRIYEWEKNVCRVKTGNSGGKKSIVSLLSE